MILSFSKNDFPFKKLNPKTNNKTPPITRKAVLISRDNFKFQFLWDAYKLNIFYLLYLYLALPNALSNLIFSLPLKETTKADLYPFFSAFLFNFKIFL